jgi:hypothetical protein
MKKALINLNQNVSYIAYWTKQQDGTYIPVNQYYENSAAVCEVVDSEFPVAEPLFWVDCTDTVIAYQYYYDTSDNTIKLIVNAPYPEEPTMEESQ